MTDEFKATQTPETEYQIPDDATSIIYKGRGIGIDNLKRYLDVEFEHFQINKWEEDIRIRDTAALVPKLVEALDITLWDWYERQKGLEVNPDRLKEKYNKLIYVFTEALRVMEEKQ
jgi:hypothetical protein